MKHRKRNSRHRDEQGQFDPSVRADGMLAPDLGQLPSYGAGDRKSMQLCAQVRRALEYGVDEVLEGDVMVSIQDVVPAPNTSHLLVFVQPLERLSFEDCLGVQAKLAMAAHKLRAMVSESIHRRKTPSITFQVIPTG